MKKVMILTAAVFMAGGLSIAYGANPEKGKALFESPKLGNGTTGKSCLTCHPGGKKLGAMDKNNLAGMVNTCIEKPLGGTAIDPQGEEMQDLIAYMKTLVAK